MRLPLSQNRLVALAVAGVVLTTALTAVLAVPGAFGDGGGTDAAPGSSVERPPAANESFSPAVQTQSGGEHEEYEEFEDHDEHEDDEHEDDEHEEYDSVPVRVVAP